MAVDLLHLKNFGSYNIRVIRIFVVWIVFGMFPFCLVLGFVFNFGGHEFCGGISDSRELGMVAINHTTLTTFKSFSEE